MVTLIPTIAFIALGALAAPMPRETHHAPPPPAPEFDCSGVMPPDEVGSYSTTNPEPLHAFYAAARESGFDGGTARIRLYFDASGRVVSAAVARSSGDQNVDRAALNWAMCTRIKPGKASTAIQPVMFRW